MGKNKGKKPPKDEAQDDDEEEAEEVTKGVANMGVGGGGAAAAPAPFSFTPGPKGQSPFGAAGGAALFTFPGSAGGAAPSAATSGAAPNFSFDFAAPKPKADKKADGEEGDEDDEDEEDEEDPVEEFIKSLPEPVQKCVSALDTLDEEICDLETQFRKDLRDLERKYEALEAPIFKKRMDIVTGASKPEGVTGTDGVPEFWLGVMRNCSAIAGTITEKDEAILHSLINVTAETLPEDQAEGIIGFKLEFTFKENEFFKNKVLTKTYLMADTSDDPVLEKAIGTEITWEPGKNVTVKIKKKKQRNKKGSGTRTVTKEEPCESFFNFFNPPAIPNPEEEPLDEEEMEQRQYELEHDYEMGIAFQERLVPHAIKWFTGEADDDDDEDDDDDDDDEDDDEPTDIDDPVDDDDGGGTRRHERDGGGAPRGRGGARGGRGGGRGAGGEECKQQ